MRRPSLQAQYQAQHFHLLFVVTMSRRYRLDERIVDLGASNTQSVVKSFHSTISQDQTDQEALEGHRLVALQQKSELNNPFDSVRLLSGLGEREDREMV